MIKYAKIINPETGLCQVGIGTNIRFYQSIGMIEMDVDLSDIDSHWYLSEKCPRKTDEEKLKEAKQNKYNEANTGAKAFLENGNALYEFEEGKHVEATDGNIGKFTGFAVGYITGKLQPTDTVDWNTKEDETVFLTQEQVGDILDGLGKVQGYVWTVQFPAYVQAIQAAQTIEEVQAIRIRYKSSPEEVIEDEIPEPVAEETPEEPEVPEVESPEGEELEEEDFILPFESEEPEDE